MEISRRDVLKAGLFGSAALLLPIERLARTKLAVANRLPQSRLPAPFTLPFTTPQEIHPAGGFLDLTEKAVSAEIIPGLKTEVWGYNGQVPGPTVVVKRGQPLTMRVRNELPELHPTLRYKPHTSVHLHGSGSLPQYDGYASDVTDPGQYKDYEYPNFQDARTMWYHDHGVHNTAANAYMGLAGLYLMHDELEEKLDIPHGVYDVPLVLKDAMFEKSGALVFDDHSESSLFGDVILVNGVPWPKMTVERRTYRFRVLNACISRSFDLALDTGGPMTVIASEGGLYPAPQKVTSYRHSMAERYEIIIDFSEYEIGQRVVLTDKGLPNNIQYDNTQVLMAFDVASEATSTAGNSIPDQLNPESEAMKLDVSQATATRQLDFVRKNGMWTVNGLIWDDVIHSGFKAVVANPGLNDVEIWEFRNKSGGWFHPIHVHLIDFRILDRDGEAPFPYEIGSKDTVYVGESEIVRVLAKFGPHPGRYMIHCHNLIHEDHDMMVQYEVGSGGNDPMLAAPAKSLSELA
jgi:FtsP/CotA-like multicopper oxidase with cupredoxin domain